VIYLLNSSIDASYDPADTKTDYPYSSRSASQGLRPLAPRPPPHEQHYTSQHGLPETIDPKLLMKRNNPLQTSSYNKDKMRDDQPMAIKSLRKSDTVQYVSVHNKSPKISSFDGEHGEQSHGGHPPGVVINISKSGEIIKHDQGTKTQSSFVDFDLMF